MKLKYKNMDEEFDFEGFVKKSPKKPLTECDTFDVTLEESLIEQNHLLNESATRKDKESIQYGDIVLVNSFIDDKHNSVVDNREHRIYVVTNTGENNAYNRTYFGYSLSSNVAISNKNNKKFPKRIYIKDYSTIFPSGGNISKQVYIDLEAPAEFTLDDLKGNNWYFGKTSNEFQQFIKDTVKMIYKKEDTSNVFWEK